MDTRVLVSIIINNYNYGRFLRQAIDSALSQNYDGTEVIIVDDGSTDCSREIISSYGERVLAVLKENGGQASAFNAGLETSRGGIVIFLDADDALLPTAVERAVQVFKQSRPVKVHWPLRVIDENGKKTGRLWPAGTLPEGDLRGITLRHGPSCSYSPPTSGNAWARSFLETVLPVPDEYKLCADDYLYALAPAFGRIGRVSESQGFYRVHGKNNYLTKTFEEKLKLGCRVQDQQCSVLSRYFRELNIEVDAQTWKSSMWFHRLQRAVQSIKAAVPAGDTFILVDEDQWGAGKNLAGRRRLHFLERNGQYWGPPEDNDTAIYELERLRRRGAELIAFAWTAFWWLDYYKTFHQHLRSISGRVVEGDQLMLFFLRRQRGNVTQEW